MAIAKKKTYFNDILFNEIVTYQVDFDIFFYLKS